MIAASTSASSGLTTSSRSASVLDGAICSSGTSSPLPGSRYWTRLAGQRPRPGAERLDRLGLVPAPGTLVPQAQAPAVQFAPAAGYQAAPAGQRPDRAAERRGVELLPAGPGGQPGPAAAVAAAVMVAGGHRAAGRGARPCGSPVAAQVAGEQPALLVPLARPPASVQAVAQPLQPAAIAGSLLRPGSPGGNRGRPGHRYRLPAATASTARRLSSSRACKYTVVEASDAWPSKARTTSRSVPARTQFVAAVCRNICGRTAKPQSLASRSNNRFAAR